MRQRFRMRIVKATTRTLALVFASWLSATPVGAQVAVFSEAQGALYPRQAIGRSAGEGEFRGWGEVEYNRAVTRGLDFRGDVIVYGAERRRALLDGTAQFVWRKPQIEIAGGLLRERWGRFTNSDLDVLGPANTPFSLVTPELRLSQPAIRTTAFFKGVSVDVYALAGGRLQPLPEKEDRFSFGVDTRNVVERGRMGDGALALRVAGIHGDIDWSSHVFVGRSRRPTFVPRFTVTGQLDRVEAIYTEIRQFGGELDTTVADWRLFTEGFVRQGAVNVSGREQTYGHVAAAAEYQRFGAFGGRYDVIPRIQWTGDTRGDQADLPFASSVRAGVRVATRHVLPVQMETAYTYDWAFRGHGVIASVEKALAESPALRLGFRFTKFSGSVKPSVLDVWKHDVELYSYLRIEMSHE
jgi:hypothetical protein